MEHTTLVQEAIKIRVRGYRWGRSKLCKTGFLERFSRDWPGLSQPKIQFPPLSSEDVPPPPAMAAASSTPVVVRSAAPAHWEGAQPSAPTPAVSRVLGRWRGARPPRHWCPKSAKARICVVMRVILSGVILHFCISGHLPFVSSLCTESCCWESSSWFIQINCAACLF